MIISNEMKLDRIRTVVLKSTRDDTYGSRASSQLRDIHWTSQFSALCLGSLGFQSHPTKKFYECSCLFYLVLQMQCYPQFLKIGNGHFFLRHVHIPLSNLILSFEEIQSMILINAVNETITLQRNLNLLETRKIWLLRVRGAGRRLFAPKSHTWHHRWTRFSRHKRKVNFLWNL